VAGRWFIVGAGIFLGQAILYGPSLVGHRILLPLDLLATENVYLPKTPAAEKVIFHDWVPQDLAFNFEMSRQFAVSELRAGRLPFWCPQQYAGVPSFRWSLSPPCLPGYFIASPMVLAWMQVLLALAAGFGAYLFFCKILRVGFWPAAIAAWCYPLTATYIVWQGFALPAVVCWLPWALFAVDRSIRQPSGWGGLFLALFTAIILLSGQTDVGGQVLLSTGLYAIWCYFDQYRSTWRSLRSASSLAVTALGWALGMMAAAWLLLPLVEYTKTGSRLLHRIQGEEERPPEGISVLPLVVLPERDGTTVRGSIRLAANLMPESASAAYAGLVATLFVAPLAWCSRRHRSLNIFWALLAFVGLSWTLNVPLLVQLLRLPGLNVMSHNRFVFVVPFAVLAMAAVGLDVLSQGEVPRRGWFLVPMVLLGTLSCWCAYRFVVFPDDLTILLKAKAEHSPGLARLPPTADGSEIQNTYQRFYAAAALLSALGLAAWVDLRWREKTRSWLLPTAAVVMIADLLRFGYGVNAQCDPALYYPRIPVLAQIHDAEPGRVVGYFCLPANLAQSHGLSDIRGYDGVDPARLLDLLAPAAHPKSPKFTYAQVQWFSPRILETPDHRIQLAPVLDMLNVRYVIFRGSPPSDVTPDFMGLDYWAVKNHRALPRVFVPKRVETITNDKNRLRLLGAAEFDAREVAYVETMLDLPSECKGSAVIADETPTSIRISCHMDTPGLVVLSDLWDVGWKVFLNGEPVPILRTNHALRGIVLPAGEGLLHFSYEPASLRTGILLAGLASFIWIVWAATIIWMSQKNSDRVKKWRRTVSS